MDRTGLSIATRFVRRASGSIARAAFVVCLGLSGGPAKAEPAADGYAAMSLIGDSLSIVTYRQSTGSSLDKNIREQIPVGDDHFDRLALRTIGAALAAARPGTTPALLLSHDAATYRRADDVAAAADGTDALLRPLAAQFDEAHARYLVLVTKRRDAARLKLHDGKVGTGWLAGLGFYIDHQMTVRNREDGSIGQGFVAPFAYLTISLVDLKTRTVIRSETIADSLPAGVRPDGTADPWQVLTSEEKVRYLDRLIERSLQEAVPRLLAGP